MIEKVYNKIVVVNENDEVIGVEMMLDAIAKGMTRSASRIYVFNHSGQVLIQRRGKNIRNPLLLDQSAAGHVDEGETRFQAAIRELEEEVGITGFELIEVVKTFASPGFLNSLYKVVVPDDIKITIEEDEVEEVMWLTLSELDDLIKNSPDECSPALKTGWIQFRDKLITA